MALLLSNRGLGLPKLRVELRASGVGMEMVPKMAHPYVRLGLEMSTPLEVIGCPRFPRILRTILGNPSVSEMALLANSGLLLPNLWVKLRASGGGLGMATK